MINIIFLFGTIGGLIEAACFFFALKVLGTDTGVEGMVFGYLSMILSLSMVFVGVKRYRDVELGGVIGFVRAFLVGLAISIIAGIIYVGMWELYMAATHYTFAEVFTTNYINAQKAAGLSGEKLDRLIAEMNSFKEQYANPLYRMPMTFMEIFPVGFLISLLSALVLRRSNVLPAQA